MMSGLNWHTTTVVNSLENKNGFAEKIKGEAIEGATFPASLEGTGKKSFIRVMDEGDNTVLQVAHVMNFYKAWDNRYGKVKSIYKAPSIAGKLAEASIDFASIDGLIPENSPVKMFKLFVYISVDGANPFYYSNDFNIKGLPFGLEFTVLKNDTEEIVAKKVYDMIMKNHIFQLDTDQIDVEVEGTTLTLRAKETFQRFALVKIAEFGPWDDYSIPVAELKADKMANEEGEVKVPEDPFKVITCVEVGKNEFGTAAQLAQDLRLPTIENLKWGSSTNWQQPLPGRTYTQYIITVAAPSNNGGVMAVGERMVSETTHIFWVIEDEDVISDFDTALAMINEEFKKTSPFEKVDTKSLADEGAAAEESEAYTEEA